LAGNERRQLQFRFAQDNDFSIEQALAHQAASVSWMIWQVF